MKLFYHYVWSGAARRDIIIACRNESGFTAPAAAK